MHVEHGVGVDCEAKSGLNVMSQSLFVALLDRGPLRSESFVFSKLDEPIEFVQVLEPDALIDLEGRRNELAQFRVALRRC